MLTLALVKFYNASVINRKYSLVSEIAFKSVSRTDIKNTILSRKFLEEIVKRIGSSRINIVELRKIIHFENSIKPDSGIFRYYLHVKDIHFGVKLGNEINDFLTEGLKEYLFKNVIKKGVYVAVPESINMNQIHLYEMFNKLLTSNNQLRSCLWDNTVGKVKFKSNFIKVVPPSSVPEKSGIPNFKTIILVRADTLKNSKMIMDCFIECYHELDWKTFKEFYSEKILYIKVKTPIPWVHYINSLQDFIAILDREEIQYLTNNLGITMDQYIRGLYLDNSRFIGNDGKNFVFRLSIRAKSDNFRKIVKGFIKSILKKRPRFSDIHSIDYNPINTFIPLNDLKIHQYPEYLTEAKLDVMTPPVLADLEKNRYKLIPLSLLYGFVGLIFGVIISIIREIHERSRLNAKK